MILGRQQRADVASQHEVWPVRALDGFGNLRVSGVNQVTDLPADGLLPAGKTTDVRVDAGVGAVCHRWLTIPAFRPPNGSVHQRPLMIAPAAVWCNAC